MRASGILLPVSSLPSKYGIGCFSKSAFEWIDFLQESGQTFWQILPLGPTSYGDSPYQSFSTFAGNPYFISLEELIEEGPDVFAEFLAGAAEIDKAAKNKDLLKNPEMLDALIGVYERNVLGYPSTAVLPYSQALSRFPAHLQQLDMESNGKSVNRFGEPVDYVTGPVIFGEPGTNGQHSFYQLLHQGTDIVPLQFIGFKNNQIGTDVVIQDSTSQQKLCANVAAQIVAFACGKEDENRNKNFEGGRPSSIIIGEQLTPKTLGALLAHFENKVMFQGFVWNVNSFDQEGVQLGKVLAKRVLAHETDGALKVYSDLLNI